MATCNDIVRYALGRLRQLRGGEIPTALEGADGMIALQSLYDTFVADGLFGRLNNTIISANYTAQEQDRVINDGGYTVTLPLTITPTAPMGSYYPTWPDERTWSWLQTTNSRPPRDLAMVEVVASGATNRYLYNAHTRAWVKLNGLLLTDLAPLSDKGAAGLAACLAELIGDDYGAPVTATTVAAATQFRWGLSAHYDSQRVGAMQDYF